MNIKIIKECSNFIKESQGKPLIKFLPTKGPDSRKIKVRWKKSDSHFNELFNSVFSDHPDLRSRCIFAHGKKAVGLLHESHNQELDLFYILPPNGYKYLYSLDVLDSVEVYSKTLTELTQKMPADQADAILKDILTYNYISENLTYGIEQGSEIILYGIPYYYAIRASTVKTYSTLFSL